MTWKWDLVTHIAALNGPFFAENGIWHEIKPLANDANSLIRFLSSPSQSAFVQKATGYPSKSTIQFLWNHSRPKVKLFGMPLNFGNCSLIFLQVYSGTKWQCHDTRYISKMRKSRSQSVQKPKVYFRYFWQSHYIGITLIWCIRVPAFDLPLFHIWNNPCW